MSKIRWLARCEPDNAARTTGVVLPHDWLTWHIGGQSFEPVTAQDATDLIAELGGPEARADAVGSVGHHRGGAVEPGPRLQTLRTQTGEISRITLTGGAAQSAAVRAIALAVFGLPIAATEPFESVAVGAAKQAAWALSGTMLDWPVPYASEQEPTAEDVAAAHEINARYESVLQTHFLRAGE